MACEPLLMCKRFITLAAREWFFPGVLPCVLFQIARSSASVIALVTLEWPFSYVHMHYVAFQLTSCNARILTQFASVWLFTRVRLLMKVQSGRCYCRIFTYIALVCLFPGVVFNMLCEFGRITKCIVALCASVRFLSSVHLDMRFEGGKPVARKVALRALVRFLPGVNKRVFF